MNTTDELRASPKRDSRKPVFEATPSYRCSEVATKLLATRGFRSDQNPVRPAPKLCRSS